MKNPESIFQNYQIKSYDDYGKKNFHEVCKKCSYEFLGKGFFSRAFKIDDMNWVIKEGRWDIDIPLIFGTKSIHGQPLQKLLSPFSYKFLPSKEESWRQYQEYLLLSRYFGFFDETYSYYSEYTNIRLFQQGLRSNLAIFQDIIDQRFGIQIPTHIWEKLPLFHNFLPREYM